MLTQFKRLVWNAWLLGTLISLLTVTIALAASGDLDTTFSGDGKVITDFSGRLDYLYDIAIQSNRKIVAVGRSYMASTDNDDFALARYNPNGSLDTTFSGDGRLITNFGGGDSAYNVAVQADGKIIASGTSCKANCDAALARYNPGGTLDTTFGGDGKVKTDFGGGDNSSGDIVIQPDGKIVVAGSISIGVDDRDFAVYRYLSNGSLDPTFGGDGRVRFDFGVGREEGAAAIAYQLTDGKIVVVGSSAAEDSGDSNFALARLNPNGTLDTTFSGDGKKMTDFGGDDFAAGFAGLADGRIVVVGSTFKGGLNYFAIARYNPDGSLDPTFNGTGRGAFSIIPGEWALAREAIAQPDGKIVIFGVTFTSAGPLDFALVRLKSGGAFDTSFSGNGKVTIDFGGSDSASALAWQPLDGKYILAGYTRHGPTSNLWDFSLARVVP
jgi:uncharacterized delta-60 repeat protein